MELIKKYNSLAILAVLIVGLIIGLYLLNQQTSLFSKASGSNIPYEVQVSNLSDNSFTVSWVTSKDTIGRVNYGENQTMDKFSEDDRGGGIVRKTHHVTLKGLKSNTNYYFKVVSSNTLFDNKGKPYQIKTAPITQDPPLFPEPVIGTVKKPDNTAPEEAIVYLKVGEKGYLSTFIRNNGNFLITLNNARTKDLTSYLVVKPEDSLSFFVQSASGGTGQLKSDSKSAIKDPVLLKVDPKNISEVFSGSSIKKVFKLPGTKWGTKGGLGESDLNQDGVVNVFDFGISLQDE